MLERLPQQAAARARRYRARQKSGRVTPIGVEVDGEVLGMLIRLHWLDEKHAADRRAIGRALTAMLRKSAEGERHDWPENFV